MRRALPIIAPPGVNRLSLGMQALNDADLKVLGRLAQCRTKPKPR